MQPTSPSQLSSTAANTAIASAIALSMGAGLLKSDRVICSTPNTPTLWLSYYH